MALFPPAVTSFQLLEENASAVDATPVPHRASEMARDAGPVVVSPAPTTTTVPAAPSPPAPSQPATPPSPTCTISAQVHAASQGPDSLCAEEVLMRLGYPLAGPPDDSFDDASVRALRAYQEANGLVVDGVLGPVTGTRMGVWDEAAAQERAAELPADSGDGRRVVYSRSLQRLWAIDADGTTVKTYLVSGRANEPQPGTYEVYSRSMHAHSLLHPDITWRYMVRFAHGSTGAQIGFHEIPVRDGVPLQSVDELGEALSAGCVRQSTDDAAWMWNWAGIGTTVVVLA